MRSTELFAHGFGRWVPFTKAGKAALIATLPKQPGVYAIRSSQDFTRRVGASDILYFGKGTNKNGLKHRVDQYFSPGHSQRTNLRILALIGDTTDYELAFVATPSTSTAVALEARLLELYEAEHGELPPENKRR